MHFYYVKVYIIYKSDLRNYKNCYEKLDYLELFVRYNKNYINLYKQKSKIISPIG